MSGDQLRFASEIVDGTRRLTEDDRATRLAPSFAAQFTVDAFNAVTDALIAENGAIRFVRILDSAPEVVRILTVDGDGTPTDMIIQFDSEGRITGMAFQPAPGSIRRLPMPESTLILLAGSVLLLAAAAAWRRDAVAEAWTLLGMSMATLAAIAVLVDVSLAYSAGRVIPNAVVAFAVMLLLKPQARPATTWIVAIALAAALVGAVTPFARDSSLIGHPAMVAIFADNHTLFRALLAVSAGLTVLAMAGVALLNMSRFTGTPMHQTRWVAGTLAIIWSAIAAASAVDLGFGHGTLAAGPFKVATWSVVAAVAAVAIFELISERWAQPEIATLVIDLESEGADLHAAVSKALGDQSLLLLTSTDGEVLTGPSGAAVSARELAADRSLTEIRSGERLVGGLVHDPALQRDPARIAAVAAAAGMALEVGRLNQMVTEQLEEVNASRARIVQASDTARRRIERDLHDGAQQRLVALGLRLQQARRLAESETGNRLVALLEDATAEVREVLDDIRAVSRGARPALLAERGLAPAVDALAERMPVPVRIDITKDVLPPDIQTTAYFVIAEGLTNVAKHAEASNAAVVVQQRNGCVYVRIDDNGRGGARLTAGSGLEGLDDRVAAAAGTLKITSDGNGTTVEVSIPCA